MPPGQNGPACPRSTSTGRRRSSGASPSSGKPRACPPNRAGASKAWSGAYTLHLEAEAWFENADSHWRRYDSIYRRAHDLDVAPDTLRPFLDWMERNERLLRAGRAILDDPATYGTHLVS